MSIWRTALRRHRQGLLLATISLLAVWALAAAGGDAAPRAATVVVTSTADSGPGSLRQAIADVGDGGAITFDLSYPAVIGLDSELLVGKSLAILGPGASRLTLRDLNASLAVSVSKGVSATLSGLTVSGGDEMNAGIYNYGALNVVDCVVERAWGGILCRGGSLSMSHSILRDNSETVGGGLCIINATVALTDVTLSGNHAIDRGGGLAQIGGELTAERVTLSSNVATDGNVSGGGGGFWMSGGDARFTNCTFSDNSSWGAMDDGGGGLLIESGAVALLNCTVTSNDASCLPGSAVCSGGIAVGNGQAVLTNTLVAANVSRNDQPDLDGVFVSGGHNLIGDAAGASGLADGVNGDQVGNAADPLIPLLGALGDYGGQTQTAPLLPGSPALDAGDDAQAPTADQRGVTRPQGSASDIGAYELALPEYASSLRCGPIELCPGYNLYCTLFVTNTSPVVTLQNVAITAEVPAGLWFAPGQAGGDLSPSYDPASAPPRIVWSAPSLAPGQAACAELTLHSYTTLADGAIITTTFAHCADGIAPRADGATVVVKSSACGSLPGPTPTAEPTVVAATPTPTATLTPTPEPTARPRAVWLPVALR